MSRLFLSRNIEGATAAASLPPEESTPLYEATAQTLSAYAAATPAPVLGSPDAPLELRYKHANALFVLLARLQDGTAAAASFLAAVF
jgi:hypothetical protein